MTRQTRKSSADARREKLRNRTKQTAENRSSGGRHFGILNLEGFDDVSFIKPELGWNKWDIIPFAISEDWYPKLRGQNGNPGGLEPGDLDYKLEVAIHSRIGIEEISVLCLKRCFGEPCFICDQITNDLSKSEKKSLYAKWRVLYNIINIQKEEGVEIFDVSEFLFEQHLLQQAENSDGEVITFSDLEEGNTVEFKAKDKKVIPDVGEPYSFKVFESIKFRDRESYNDDILEQVYPLDSMLKILTYKEQERIYLGLDEEKPEIEEENTEPEIEDDEDIPLCPPGDASLAEEDGCPSGGAFGADVNELDDCPDCPQETFDTCCDEKDRLDEEEKAKKEKPKSRTRTAKPKKRVRGNK